MIIFPTSVTPDLIMISTYPGIRSGVTLLPSPWDTSTSTSSMVIISISTLTSVPKSPLGILCVIWSGITSSIINSNSCYFYHLTYSCSICLLIYFYNLACNCFFCYIPSITSLISASAVGSISWYKILLT